MEIDGRIVVITGAAQGIGRALAHALAAGGARVIAVDVDKDGAEAVAAQCGGLGIGCDVTDPAALKRMVETAIAWQGRIDALISNAGIAHGEPDGPTSAPDAIWQKVFDLHVMAHLRAARLVLPEMIARGDGLLVSVASAAGLLSQVGDAAYSATKHAAVSLAQSLAIEHGHQGIRVSVVCPQYVATPLLGYEGEDRPAHPGVLSADVVAQRIVQGIKDDLFLILPHPETAAYFRMRAEAPEAWISGMQRLRARVMQDGPLDLKTLHRRV
ncbi:3-oxoacyl-[acyl-carrier-protein] reductase FabG [Roseivivax sp. THAF40]|uniref:SDR family NAD(P)-dependent oxidoreductase n=1 Tax=unclassified Roseivivax TaxID=2639302 RepID=UPI0012684C11|nr:MULTISPECIES: SDR family NAD(P)-dependent oxidoreductase [unclassified Roseivivax]QFS84685.1 3-oxoacyl-[acyl-carrier-protein] reductase FabG [Roseivivax sp. THAF197b]QFT48512.1 3-oxoacyl-[acyl-carrier-protein] reductase FabG [Roseivivax sp. THAF40]